MAALRRRQQGIQHTQNSIIVEPIPIPFPIPIPPEDVDSSSSSSSSSSLAAKATRASSGAHKDSSLSSAYASIHPSSVSRLSNPNSTLLNTQETKSHDYTSRKNQNESKRGFWGSLARKAKAFLDDEDHQPQVLESDGRAKQQIHERGASDRNAYQSPENHRKADTPALQKGLGAITSSLNYIGNAVEEGFTVVENRTAGIIQETRKHIRKKPSSSLAQNQAAKQPQMPNQVPQMQTDQEIQLKASRDVAMAMAAKAKLLLRELKTVKADLAFAKERCAQLEEENRILRENSERGENSEDDDLIRLQLETLLAEKARLAHDNSVYARENRFLREVVEYHQLTMQDVVYLDEKTEEVTEVHPIQGALLINTNAIPTTSPRLPPETSLDISLEATKDISVRPMPPPEFVQGSHSQSSGPRS
ncbi:hypothetical protein SLE2022_286610 [Rubroshorea leprosula]